VLIRLFSFGGADRINKLCGAVNARLRMAALIYSGEGMELRCMKKLSSGAVVSVVLIWLTLAIEGPCQQS